MIELTHIVNDKHSADGQLTLPIEQRVRSRLRARLDDGRDVGLFLPRGTLLRGGDQLGNDDGLVIDINAAPETVSTLHSDDPTLLARAAYHLGNRHIPLQVEKGWLRYQHDHVLDDMLRQMGLEPVVEQAPFEPEAGAYQQAAEGHHHSHTHSHSHE
ncbi:Urease accessory protein UreE [hydrothermal vent metagenome]|uniref:Urease accessory protein UreE n=1 Tax=hydrothermal vent metagenome TaxID=652676 RepID=A0A3B1ADB2_9ZZZZ